MSRRFAEVGVGIAAARLREMAAGAPAADAELTDVEFALLANELRQDRRFTAFARGRRCVTRWLVAAVMCLVMLGSLLFATWLMLSLMVHTAPF